MQGYRNVGRSLEGELNYFGVLCEAKSQSWLLTEYFRAGLYRPELNAFQGLWEMGENEGENKGKIRGKHK